MPFLQLTLTITRNLAESLSDALNELGAQAITFQDAHDQPIYAHGPGAGETVLWDQIVLTALFDGQTDMPQLIEHLESQFGMPFGNQATVELIADQTWEHTWKDDFKPQCYLN